jgi:hypothetical protein
MCTMHRETGEVSSSFVLLLFVKEVWKRVEWQAFNELSPKMRRPLMVRSQAEILEDMKMFDLSQPY